MDSETSSLAIEDSDDLLIESKELNDVEYDIPTVMAPSLESVLWELESEEGSDNISLHSLQSLNYKCRSVLHHAILQGISSQILSARDRVDAGLPTVIANSTQLVAVGTSHGFTLTFDSEQKLCWCFHDLNMSDQGAVSALTFNLNSTRLLVGYERGYISMINALTGDVIRRLPDAHAPQTAVLHLRFSSLDNIALSGDSAGCVFSLTFHKRLGLRTWDSKCLFSGARGEVCTFEPLIDNHEIRLLGENVLVAIATLSKVIVISIKPHLKILFTQQLPKLSTTLPVLGWQIVSVGKLLQPVLAWGRNNELNYARVVTGLNNNKIRISSLRSIQLPYTLCAIHWLGLKYLAVIDTSENLRLIEVRTQHELEIIELANIGLVYSSAHFKALALGGGVSEAFALAGERACYNSIAARGDQLLLLGTKSVHLIKVRTWPERLIYLSEQDRWTEALNLAASEGSNREKATNLLLERFLSSIDQIGVDRDSLAAAVNCCIKLKKTDILCNDLWNTISSDQVRLDWYYTLLTDNICEGSLYFLNPSVAQALVQHLENKDANLLENVLLSIDLSCLDLHQVLKICKRLNLYDAWIHITTKTMDDFISPITEFIRKLTPDNNKLGNTLLVYVSACLSGLGYPHGQIPNKDVLRIKHDILRCLETVHSINSIENESRYPYLRALLKYNTRECLNVISLAFNEAEFCGEMGLLQRQRLVKILLQIVTPPEFNCSEVIVLACFISRLIASNNLILEENILNSVIKSLTNIERKSLSLRDHMDREQAWIDLQESNKFKHLNLEDLLNKALESKCYRIVECIYETQKKFSNILDCYLNDSSRNFEVFNYILRYIDDIERDIHQQFSINFKKLANIDVKQTAKITLKYFFQSIDHFCKQIEDNSQLVFVFLNNIVYSEFRVSPHLAEQYLNLLCIENSDMVYSFIKLNLCRVHEALKITQLYEIHSASGFLMEQNGDFHGALSLFLKNNMYEAAVEVCIRGSEHLDSVGAREIWLRLLNHSTSCEFISLRELLHSAAPHIPPTNLLELVRDANLGDIKILINGILTDYQYDIQMLDTTLKLLSYDLHHGLTKSLIVHQRGLIVQNIKCSICQHSLLINSYQANDPEKLYICNCSHCYHSNCMGSFTDNTKCIKCKATANIILHPKNSHYNKIIPSNAIFVDSRPDLEGHF